MAIKRWVGIGLLVLALTFVFLQGSETPRKYPDRIAVRFWHRWQADWEKQVQKIVDAFNQSQDKYEVIPLSTPSGGADCPCRIIKI